MMGAFGILLYVGAEVAIGSYLVNYFIDMDMHKIIQSTPWMNNIAISILSFPVFRCFFIKFNIPTHATSPSPTTQTSVLVFLKPSSS